VHEVVHGHEPAARGVVVLVAVPAVDQDGGVVVPVEEDELLFAQDYEQRVHQLGQLRHYKGKRPEAGYAFS